MRTERSLTIFMMPAAGCSLHSYFQRRRMSLYFIHTKILSVNSSSRTPISLIIFVSSLSSSLFSSSSSFTCYGSTFLSRTMFCAMIKSRNQILSVQCCLTSVLRRDMSMVSMVLSSALGTRRIATGFWAGIAAGFGFGDSATSTSELSPVRFIWCMALDQ